MPDQEIAFVALGETAAAHVLHEALAGHGLPVRWVPPDRLDPFVSTAELPSMVILRAPELSVTLVEMVRRLRDQDLPVQVILDSVTEDNEVALLHSGVLEVLSDTTSPRLMYSRVSAMYRHLLVGRNRQIRECYEFEELTVDVHRREAQVAGEPLALTRTEFDLLVNLIREPHRIFSRATLQNDTAGARSMGERSLESHLSRLRTKIREAGGPRVVEAVRGIGYRLSA